jgi:hypothetical protein
MEKKNLVQLRTLYLFDNTIENDVGRSKKQYFVSYNQTIEKDFSSDIKMHDVQKYTQRSNSGENVVT